MGQTARAEGKYLRISPLKVNFICKEIRGKQVDEALAILRFTPKKGARLLEKVLKSAIANAENNFGLDRDKLIVEKAYANNAPVMKRFHPKAKGAAYPILKRSSHIGCVVREVSEEENNGSKVNPHGLRVGIIKDWDSKWFADKKILGIF